jgi:hypothetical protein
MGNNLGVGSQFSILVGRRVANAKKMEQGMLGFRAIDLTPLRDMYQRRREFMVDEYGGSCAYPCAL